MKNWILSLNNLPFNQGSLVAGRKEWIGIVELSEKNNR